MNEGTMALKVTPNTERKCTGLIFKCYSSTYVGDDLSINHKEGFRLLKRKSCGCAECYAIVEAIRSYGKDLVDFTYWTKLINQVDPEDGAEYKFIPEWSHEGLEGFHFVLINN